MASIINERKAAHIEICCREGVEFRDRTTLLECVEFVHKCVPELSPGEPDLSVDAFGRRLRAPLLIGALTGGTEAGGRINRDLAAAAAESGIGLGVGSQRAMLADAALVRTFQVRDVAPDILLLANIGLYQARDLETGEVERLLDAIEADGICVHLNAAMELFQREGDRDFSGGLRTLERLASALGDRLVVKETGCGVSREMARQIRDCGVRRLDVAGAGGTSWVRIENIRNQEPEHPARELFEEWGIPTGASLCEVAGLGFDVVIGSGGIRTGLDMARAIALGADLASAALPFLRAHERRGVQGVRDLAAFLVDGLKSAAVLTGCRTVADLQNAPVVIRGGLREWLASRGMVLDRD